MSDRVFTFFVPATPVAQPRQRHRIAGKGREAFVQSYVPTDHPVHGWKDAIREAAFRAAAGEFFVKDEPVGVEMVFVFERPASHFKKSGMLAKGAPRFKTSKPDLDNLEKALKDACTAVIWHDDAQVTYVWKRKKWSERESGLLVSVFLDDEDADEQLLIQGAALEPAPF